MKITVNTSLNMGLVWSPFTSRADWILGYITHLALLQENIIASFRVLLNLPLEYWFEIPAVQNECWETIRKPSESCWDCQSDSARPTRERMETNSSQNATRGNGHKLWLEMFSLQRRESILQWRRQCNPGRNHPVVVSSIVLLQAGGWTRWSPET